MGYRFKIVVCAILLLCLCGCSTPEPRRVFDTADLVGNTIGGVQIVSSSSDIYRNLLAHAVWLRPAGATGAGVVQIDLMLLTDTSPQRFRKWLRPARVPHEIHFQNAGRIYQICVFIEESRIIVEVEGSQIPGRARDT